MKFLIWGTEGSTYLAQKTTLDGKLGQVVRLSRVLRLYKAVVSACCCIGLNTLHMVYEVGNSHNEQLIFGLL